MTTNDETNNPLMMVRCAATFDDKRCGQPAGHGEAHTAHIPFYAPWYEEGDGAETKEERKLRERTAEDVMRRIRDEIVSHTHNNQSDGR